MLKFETRRVTNSYGDSKKYRGMLTRSRGVVDFDAVLREVAESRRLNPTELRYYIETFFDCVREMMLEDGCSRRIGDYLLLRLNVRGSFDQADDDITTGKQELLITGQALDSFRHLECQNSRTGRVGDVRAWRRRHTDVWRKCPAQGT